MQTTSENSISKINQCVFYKEFTFDKNEFSPRVGQQKELADNVIFLDNLLFIIQIKERNPQKVKTAEDENKWFRNVVLKKAKNQIKDSLDFFATHSNIQIINKRQHSFNVAEANLHGVNKIIIYSPNSNLVNDKNRSIKFYESKEAGNIHIFHLEDYHWICKYLITPTELDEYLKFRERIYIKHKAVIEIYQEQYILAHFLNTDDETVLNEKYIETLGKLFNDREEFDMSTFLDSFSERIFLQEQKQARDYYSIIKEIAKLKRYELLEFKKRFQLIINTARDNTFSMPYRFTINRTGCGFVFIALTNDKIRFWESALLNFTELYKYKRKLNKCLGVIVYKSNAYFDVYWAYAAYDWIYDEVMEEANKQEVGYGNGEVKTVDRYKFNDS